MMPISVPGTNKSLYQNAAGCVAPPCRTSVLSAAARLASDRCAHFERGSKSYSGNAAGFTLLELLVVLVIAGIMLGVVSLNAMPGDRQIVQNEAQRIALLLQLARDEAIVRNHPIAFEADPERYRFLIRQNDSWQPLTQDAILREREFKRAPLVLTISPATTSGQAMRIVFGREPVDKAFVLTLTLGGQSAAVRADGIGHFQVE